MKTLKPEEVTEPGYYWAKRNDGAQPTKVVEVWDFGGVLVYSCPHTFDGDLRHVDEFRGPIPNAFEDQPEPAREALRDLVDVMGGLGVLPSQEEDRDRALAKAREVLGVLG